MGLIAGLKNLFGGETKAANNPYSDSNFFNHLLGSTKHAGVQVNYSSAMRHQDVYTCVRIKSEALGQLPTKLYRKDGDGNTQEIMSGREYDIFTQKPNSYMTWQEFKEMYITSIELLGNFYAEVKRNRYGNVYEVLPFKHQNNVFVGMDVNGQVYYTYTTNDGKGKITKVTYSANDIMHIKLNSDNGYLGLSPIKQTARTIGSAIAGEDHSSALFENGARPSGVLETDESFGDDEEAVSRLRKQWNEIHSGPGNSGKVAVLEYGMKFNSIQMSAVDAQLIEQRKYSREQISSIFRVPSHMLNDPSGMKYNSIEHNNTAFFRDALMPLVTKLEFAISLMLPDNHYIKLDERVFVRGDRETQVKTVKEELTAGLISVNEGRELLGHDHIDGGDVFAVQTNNLTFGRYDELPGLKEQLESSNPTGTQPPTTNKEAASGKET